MFDLELLFDQVYYRSVNPIPNFICLQSNLGGIVFGFIGGESEHSTGKGTVSSASSSKVSASSLPSTPRSEDDILSSSTLKSFTFNDLRTTTRNFRPDSVLGEGGFGSVFKGWIDETTLAAAKPGTGLVIAVKKLNQEGFQGHREWLVRLLFCFFLDFSY